uniref:(northern house mosquito) hypothetical protein n=1 Tax=Culex pipiens TaxID=7175 RepID=A0A8D8DL53_CULPI
MPPPRLSSTRSSTINSVACVWPAAFSRLPVATRSSTTRTRWRRPSPEGNACTRSARTRPFRCTTFTGATRATRPTGTRSVSTVSRRATRATMSSSSGMIGE